jgi:hypothetical protein
VYGVIVSQLQVLLRVIIDIDLLPGGHGKEPLALVRG